MCVFVCFFNHAPSYRKVGDILISWLKELIFDCPHSEGEMTGFDNRILVIVVVAIVRCMAKNLVSMCILCLGLIAGY